LSQLIPSVPHMLFSWEERREVIEEAEQKTWDRRVCTWRVILVTFSLPCSLPSSSS
jgi:hypothetical protein